MTIHFFMFGPFLSDTDGPVWMALALTALQMNILSASTILARQVI